jgi:hypothetical protein
MIFIVLLLSFGIFFSSEERNYTIFKEMSQFPVVLCAWFLFPAITENVGSQGNNLVQFISESHLNNMGQSRQEQLRSHPGTTAQPTPTTTQHNHEKKCL